MASQSILFELWMNDQGEEAVQFYKNVFGDVQLGEITPYTVETPSNKPIGTAMTVDFTLKGKRFQILNGGPDFRPTPATSFMVNFDPSRDTENVKASAAIDACWEKLLDGGKILMDIGEYPFSKRYGWVEDKYGVSWQLILTNPEGEERPEVLPCLLFVGGKLGKAEEAMRYYLSVFTDSQPGQLVHYGPGMEPNKEGTVMFSDFKLLDTWFVAMDGGGQHELDFTEGISFVVECNDQAEIDYYWGKLSHVPEAEACGWCKDKFGVSWQIVPKHIAGSASWTNKAVMEAVLKMKKIDIATLEAAAKKE